MARIAGRSAPGVVYDEAAQFDYSRPVHWLPRPLNEVPLTACSLDVTEHPKIQFTRSQNEATCRNCLAFRGSPDREGRP